MENVETKQCPLCAETILKAAIRCKHCGGDIGGGASIPRTKKSETLGQLMVATPLVAALLILFWVGSMALIQNPGSTLNLLVVVTVVGTAILAAAEAKQVGAGSNVDLTPKGRKRSGPVSWFAVTLVLWVVGFPGWLYQRKRYGLKNLVVGGIVVMAFFVGSFAVMNTAIERKKGEIRGHLAGVPRSLQQSSFQAEEEEEQELLRKQEEQELAFQSQIAKLTKQLSEAKNETDREALRQQIEQVISRRANATAIRAAQ